MKSHFSTKQGVLVAHLRLGQVASFTDYPFCPVVLQLSWPFSFLYASHVWHFGESLVASHSWVLVAKILLIAHTLEFFTLSHTQPFHDSHVNTRYLIAELQTNLARNKSNTWLNKFNLTIKCGFHDIHALFYIVVHSLHARCLIKCLLGIFSLIWTLMSTKFWGF